MVLSDFWLRVRDGMEEQGNKNVYTLPVYTVIFINRIIIW
jgi:hypothetical protein